MAGSANTPASGAVVRGPVGRSSCTALFHINTGDEMRIRDSVNASAPWLWARDKMKSARFKQRGKPLCTNTSLVVSRASPTQEWETDETVYACEYHCTEVVRYFPDGTVAASFQGWPTVTTKLRISAFSPFTISTDRGQVMAIGNRGQKWLGDDYTWFYWKEDTLVFHDGSRVPSLLHARRKDTVPKRRDTLSLPMEGDAFRDSGGSWIATGDGKSWPQRLMLHPYLGDLTEERGLVVTDQALGIRDLPSNLELLARAGSEGGLQPINRFLWEAPTRRK
jgi:hypothetical protein